ncbi:MAG: hypothetical protein ACPGF7_10420 [Pontibacterium sp.]
MKLSSIRLVNLTAVFFVASFLAACTSQPVLKTEPKSSLVISVDSRLLPALVGESLTENLQAVSLLVSSGQYQGKTLTAEAAYFAASGRSCRKVLISDQLTNKAYIACQSGKAGWVLVRSAS